MSDQFSWRTDDEDGWDEPPTRPSSEVKRRRPWLWLIAVAAAAITISLVLYLRLQEQVETATTTAEAELLAAHQLIQQAAATNDLDLFRSNLSRRDPEWADAQRALISTGLFLDRSAFGLRWWGETELNLSDAAATPTLPLTITLSPDLLSAEVVYEDEYLIAGSVAVSQTIRLQHTAVYRRGSGRWLRADPLPEFWGALRTTEREYLTVTYSRRDEAIVQRLADDFDAELQRMCDTLAELDCTALHLELRLTRDPASFFSLVQLVDVIAPEEGEIILPAPTLVGLPLDDAGYELIMKGYTAQLVAAAITQLLAYECCHHGFFYHAFMDRLLHDLDVRPTPLVTTPVEPGLNKFVRADMTSLWGRESLDYAEVTTLPYLYGLADFLIATTKPPITALNLLNGLRPNVSFQTWLGEVISEPNASLTLITTRWATYVAEQSNLANLLPLPLPSGSVHLSCYAEGNSDTYHILRYDLETQHWTEEENLHQFFAPTANGYVTVVEEPSQNQLIYVDTLNLQTAVITATTTSNQTFQPNYFFSSQLYGSPPDGHFYFASLEYTSSGQPLVDHWLADLTRCETGNCAVERLAGTPIWSPDGEHLILYDDEGEDLSDNLFVADGMGKNPVAIGQGYLPFWLDSSHYGYFTRDDSDQLSTVMTGDVDQTVPQAALTSVDIRSFLQPDLLPYFYLAWAMPRPQATPNTTVMLALGGENIESTNHYYVLELQWNDTWETIQDVQILREADHGMFPSYSPDGRYLVLIEQAFQAFRETHLTLVNQETQAEQTYTITDFFNFPNWAKDGRWLIQITTREIVLIAPDFEVEQRIPFTATYCNYYHYVPGE